MEVVIGWAIFGAACTLMAFIGGREKKKCEQERRKENQPKGNL